MKLNDFCTKTALLIAFPAFILVSCQWEQRETFVDRPPNVTNAAETVYDIDAVDAQNVDVVSHEIFGDVKIISSEYLYNLDDSPDYIYVDFEDYGYAVYFKDTMEMMEYAPYGNLPYQDTRARRYYGGPTNYFIKEEDQFVNTYTGESFRITSTEAESFSRQIVDIFSINSAERGQDQDLIETEETYDNSHAAEEGDVFFEEDYSFYTVSFAEAISRNSAPDYVKGNPIEVPPGATWSTYIPNAEYFIEGPKHGKNTSGTCGAVTSQLLLSYNNYYHDRRIIQPQHLNGGWNSAGNGNINDPSNYASPNNDPNACTDPRRMTSKTLGSNGYNEGDAGTYFKLLVDKISNSAPVGKTRRGIRDILNDRNISFTIKSDNTLTLWPIGSAKIKEQINAGRPLIIAMSPNLGGANHYVVGYGYLNYTYPNGGGTYSGYIAHWGWDPDEIKEYVHTWINESWCYGYISLQINHTHSYVSTGDVLNGQEMILRCTACNHRKTDTLFIVLGNKIANLKYTITSAASITIPESLNNVPITAIGNSAFASQTYIIGVTIPATVTSIGDNAFLNTGIWNNTPNNSVVYADLWAVGYKGSSAGAVTLNPGITGIGDYAFFQKNIIYGVEIPGSVSIIGARAFSYNPYFHRVWIPTSVTNIGSSAFVDCSSLTIYAQAPSKPPEWHANWNYYNRPVIWNSPEAYKETINAHMIQGVPVPVAGEPTAANISTAQYTGTVAWNPNHSVFQAQTKYTATVTLTATQNYSMLGVTANFFKIPEASTSNAAGSGVVSAVFAYTAKTVTLTSVQGVSKPVAGAAPVSQIIETEQYTGTVEWWPMLYYPLFTPYTVYTATVTLTPKDGYTFYGVAANSFPVAGADTSNAADSGELSAVFPATSGYFSGGNGTIGSPYEIRSVQHLKNIPMANIQGAHFALMNNIDLQAVPWTPITVLSPTFTLNGNGYTIYNLKINSTVPSGNYGLFAVNKGTIKNLHISGQINVNCDSVKAGMFAGTNTGTIQNCGANSYDGSDVAVQEVFNLPDSLAVSYYFVEMV